MLTQRNRLEMILSSTCLGESDETSERDTDGGDVLTGVRDKTPSLGAQVQGEFR
jgi:hypothetical protein